MSSSILLWTVVSFTVGAVPFSVLIGRIAQGVDIRTFGDHNPGATNVLRATGSKPLFIIAFMLDYLKGVVPLGMAYWFYGISGWSIVPVALAPLIGHSYSPFLHFKGGKAIATTFGIWTGLTLGVGPTILGLLISVMFFTLTSSGWASFLAMLTFGVFVVTYYGGALSWIWLGNLLLIVIRHWDELRIKPGIRPEVFARLRAFSR